MNVALHELLVVVLVCMATFRVSWLITRDELPPVLVTRERIAERFGEDSSLTYLSTCPWCVSVWVGAALTAATVAFTSLPVPALVWATSSAVTGLLAAWLS